MRRQLKWIRKNKGKTRRYIYFYYATFAPKNGERIFHLNGYLTWFQPIDTYEKFLKARKMIGKDNKINPSEIVIHSLNFLHETNI